MYRQKVSFFLLFIFIFAIFTFTLKPLMSNVLSNIGWIYLKSSLTRFQPIPKDEPSFFVGVLENDQEAYKALDWFDIAHRLSPSTTSIEGLGHTALAIGDFERAATTYQTYLNSIQNSLTSPYLIIDALLAFSLNNQHSFVISLYEITEPHLATVDMLDLVALSYINEASAANQINNQPKAIIFLEKALELRPSDLYANFFLLQLVINNGDTTTSESALNKLYYFSGSSLHPKENRLIPFVTSAVSALIKNNIWNYEIAHRVFEALVWLENDAPELENLVNNWVNEHSNKPESWIIFGEFYLYRGQFPRAISMFKKALALDPNNLNTLWHLATICPKAGTTCSEDDILSNYQLLISDQNSDTTFDTQAFDVSWTSEQLNLPRHEIQFDENLLNRNNSNNWMIMDEIHNTIAFRSNPYLGDTNWGKEWADSSSIRLLGLWNNFEPGSVNPPEWYGVYAWDEELNSSQVFQIESNSWYIVTAVYRTEENSNSLHFHISRDTQIPMTTTDGSWSYFRALVCDSDPNGTIMVPLIYLSNPNDQVWLDEISIRKVHTTSNPSVSCRLIVENN